jgi:RNA polymerase sigma-70 factor, ECF subfamily
MCRRRRHPQENDPRQTQNPRRRRIRRQTDMPATNSAPHRTGPNGAATTSDEELMRRIKYHNDRQAFDTLTRRLLPDLQQFLWRQTRNERWSEDALQATLQKLYSGRMAYDDSRKVRPWVFGIARYAAVNTYRYEFRHAAPSIDAGRDQSEIADVQSLPDEALAIVSGLLADLPVGPRIVVTLRNFANLKFREISEVLRQPISRVYRTYTTALLRLRMAIEQTLATRDRDEPDART